MPHSSVNSQKDVSGRMNRMSGIRSQSTVTGNATYGRMHVHFNPTRRKYRLRFTSVHEDQMETIALALRKARDEAETVYDVVALEMICLSYLANGSARR